MRISYRTLLVLAATTPAAAYGQTGFVGPDGYSRYPGVTMLCPNGTHAVPCNFTGGSSGGTVSVSMGGTLVGAGNRFAVTDSVLDGLVSGGTLAVGLHGTGNVSLAAGSSVIGGVTESGNWTVGIASLPALPAGSNAIGSVSVSNFPGTQTVAGSVSATLAGTPSVAVSSIAGTVTTLPSAAGTQSVMGTLAVSNFPGTQTVAGAVSQSGAWSVGVSSLPALPSGSNALGSVSVSNFPGTQTVAGSVTLAGSNTVTLASGSNSIGTVTTVPSANNVPAYLQAVSSGGATAYGAVNAAASCMATSLKSSSGMVFDYSISNSNTAGVWLRLFASASAPTCGSGTPLRRVYVPANSTVSLASDLGWVFSGGIGYDVTSGSGADTDSTVIGTASTVLVNIDYK